VQIQDLIVDVIQVRQMSVIGDAGGEVPSIDSSVLRDEGRIVHTQCFTRDITDQKQAEERLRQSYAELSLRAEELARFNHVAVGRELRMIELKKEVKELCARLNQCPPYPLKFEKDRKEIDAGTSTHKTRAAAR
jgi:hypothetical protein